MTGRGRDDGPCQKLALTSFAYREKFGWEYVEVPKI